MGETDQIISCYIYSYVFTKSLNLFFSIVKHHLTLHALGWGCDNCSEYIGRSITPMSNIWCNLHISHWTVNTIHCLLYALYSTTNTSQSTLYTIHFILHTSHYTLHTAHFTLYTSYCTLHTKHFILHTSHYTHLH